MSVYKLNGLKNYRSALAINCDTLNQILFVPYWDIDYGYRSKSGEGEHAISAFTIVLKSGMKFAISGEDKTHDGMSAYDVEEEFKSFISNLLKNYTREDTEDIK